jgi:hypothetical protein
LKTVSMYLFKVAFFGMLLLFGAVAIFLGAVTGYAALQNGEMTVVWSKGSSVVSRLADPSGFWQRMALASLLPMAGGVLAIWFGRRGLGQMGN